MGIVRVLPSRCSITSLNDIRDISIVFCSGYISPILLSKLLMSSLKLIGRRMLSSILMLRSSSFVFLFTCSLNLFFCFRSAERIVKRLETRVSKDGSKYTSICIYLSSRLSSYLNSHSYSTFSNTVSAFVMISWITYGSVSSNSICCLF